MIFWIGFIAAYLSMLCLVALGSWLGRFLEEG